jgi:gluconolactonase
MMGRRRTVFSIASLACGIMGTLAAIAGAAQPAKPVPATHPVINLMTEEGVAQVGGQWRFSDVRIVEVSSKATDDYLTKLLTQYPAASPPAYFPQRLPFRERKTYDIEPHAHGVDYDDSKWDVIAPKDLTVMRGGGQLSYAWYRIRLKMPATVGGFSTAGSKAYLTINADDYQEIWVNGDLPRSYGKPSPNVVSGMNMPSRVLLSDGVKPGETISVAVFGINGPLSQPALNRIFIRQAEIDFQR